MVRSAPPNILLVIADDHQAAAIGALGHAVVRTPALDTWGRDGTAFTRVGIRGSLMAAVWAPSRACLLTGHTVMRADAAPHLVTSPEFQVTLPAEVCAEGSNDLRTSVDSRHVSPHFFFMNERKRSDDAVALGPLGPFAPVPVDPVDRVPLGEPATVPGSASPPAAEGPLSADEQMERFAQDLKENDWGHQPC